MSLSLEDAIIRTICYADVFDFPLTIPEVRKYLIGFSLPGLKEKDLIKKVKYLPDISSKSGYYFLKGRETNVSGRLRKEYFSGQKYKLLQKILKFMTFWPQVLMIGVTGTLAMNNADRDDDIDLLLVSDSRQLWTTRFLVVSLLKTLGLYRNPKDTKVNNKICLNMYLDENHLELPVAERDLYSAHEIIQLLPVYDRGGYYQKFRSSNSWVNQFLPNSEVFAGNNSENPSGKSRQELFTESILRKIQLWKINKNLSNEVIRPGFLRFHPHDNREKILKKYQHNLQKIHTIP
ncbi:MAG: hypothetical protein UV73_C0003G0141 [Candidatus Gottesmanbacteria bacterium GW2011_GWA2_43_14]|uniref:Polymerase nucleotidyl transferase domain-containing protein n=1 Tax=Candidatus Gottesmanbacteria bacterium GW2011_GWA2_43_14 TaxID=1618443 RepID=A0A0G1DKM7_9BACT|nr:MAG: hypothetical protein UV73_C0003G0141 [Candidatus Gottesmanbacteria bacterium GW2011_GWA2_43_14]